MNLNKQSNELESGQIDLPLSGFFLFPVGQQFKALLRLLSILQGRSSLLKPGLNLWDSYSLIARRTADARNVSLFTSLNTGPHFFLGESLGPLMVCVANSGYRIVNIM
jgi:hypothetical protein